MLYRSFAFGAVVGCVSGAVASASKPASNNNIPQYFQTKPEMFAGWYSQQALLVSMLIMQRSNSDWCRSIFGSD
jgi:hypothetical protein